MFTLKVQARFGEIDALGHVNNTVVPAWFELARKPVMQIFDSELTVDKKTFPLIMAHTDFDYLSQMYLRYEVEIKTWVSKIGNKSFTVYHEAFQQDRLCVKGSCVIVYYDYGAGKTAPVPEDKKKLLAEHLTD